MTYSELQKENADLKAALIEKEKQALDELNERIQQQKIEIKNKNIYIQQLEELVKQSNRKFFAPSSEKVSPDQLGLFNEAEEIEQDEASDATEEIVTVESHQRQKKKTVRIPEHLPREEIVYDLTEEEKVCPHDGTALKVIGSEDHEQLDIIPAQVKVLKHKRLKYACPCCEQHIVTASKPKQPIEKSLASPGLLAFIATQKYCDALPLYRQSEILSRTGIELHRSNLANWMIKCGELIQPLYNLMHEQLLQRQVIHMDETTLQVLKEPDKTPQSLSYMWLMANFDERPITLFHYASTRSQQIPLEQLLDTQNQAIMVDGYEGYQKACNDYALTRLGCWAHARRKFVDAQKLQGKTKGKVSKADQAIAFIQKLYVIEKKLKDKPNDERYAIRQQQAKPIIDKIQKWLEKSLPNVPPKTALGKALHYLHNQWPRLTAYLEDGAYSIDNNLAENQIRPFAVGRKNWLFANSQAGAKASANLYSLIQTAKANSLNPYDYLKHVFKALPNANSVEDMEKLLPWNLPETLNN